MINLKVKSGLFTDMRGSIGGVTATSWKGIMVLKRKPMPANPNTAQQATQRGYMTAAVLIWQAFTGCQKQAYNRVAALLTAPMSGFNLLIKRKIAEYLGGSAITTPTAGDVECFATCPSTTPRADVLVQVFKAGSTLEVFHGYTDALGAVGFCLTNEDQNYDVRLSKAGFATVTDNDLTAANVFKCYSMPTP